ncbi:hypothetical protein [Vitiosangium sp. GDMCC 1.1324]|uniref:hypothetical protein n=1 Tax=Vitiosangium sp. (strain GDMCC 1.1324) TaxID=2138576 RepID=UPI000D379AB3|nr:hypothetical protein [Vitiosangium sp. GDMCC 1.1324]PTL76120.1 hypothetical protein DAT35_51025 [Vitiosangium sp. GDMCC 1.1324]
MKLGAWSPLLTLFGGTPSRSYVEVAPDSVTFRFGAFVARIPLADVSGASRAHWPLLGGIGWRIGPGAVGLIGSLQNVVEVTLRQPHRVRVMGIPVKARRVFVSLEDPEAFLADLAAARGSPQELRA